MHNQLWLTVISFNSMVAFLPVAAVILVVKPAFWPHALSIFAGILAGFVNLQGAENQLTALILIAFPFFLGFSQTEKAWRWALLTGVWVPLSELVRAGITDQGRLSFESASIVLVMGFPILGAYAGLLLRRLAQKQIPALPSDTDKN